MPSPPSPIPKVPAGALLPPLNPYDAPHNPRSMKRKLLYSNPRRPRWYHLFWSGTLVLWWMVQSVDGWHASSIRRNRWYPYFQGRISYVATEASSWMRRRMSHAPDPPEERSSSWEEVYTQRWQQQIALLRAKDRSSTPVAVEDLKIVYEDDDIIVVDKPAGILCLPSEEGVPSIAETVYHYVQQASSNATLEMDQMVVHRLGYETAGLLVLAKTIPAVRGLHTLFRMRPSQRSAPGSRRSERATLHSNDTGENNTTTVDNSVTDEDDSMSLWSQHLGIVRQYEVLVVGHVANGTDELGGWINLPLMRCYEYPPYMRVSTQEQQQFLLSLDPAQVGKKLLEAPKHSLTHYEIVAHEYWQQNASLPVTRLTLTSMTGRTHQLNVHCAAIGHPIVRDTVYGYNGTAAPQGGLSSSVPIDSALPAALAEAARDAPMCVHAKYMRFPHPITGADLEFTSAPAF